MHGLSGVEKRSTRIPWLAGLTCVAWLPVATMRYWWSPLWRSLGVVSVPIDVFVWIAAIILTVLVAPELLHRVDHAGVVLLVVGALLVGGTAVVLSPWHNVLSKAVAQTGMTGE
ncbi:MAG TPA: hypothetical protein VFX16_05860 [Pseudonocardiaceae bacterium]|nr:hypothetical protein [Pseudonocardiaceae bacterium]